MSERNNRLTDSSRANLKMKSTTHKSKRGKDATGRGMAENRSSHTFPSLSVTASDAPHGKAIESYKVALAKIREQLVNDPYVPIDVSDSQMIEYMNCTHFEVDKCVPYMKGAYRMMFEMPSVFNNRDPTSPESQQYWNVVYMAVFPKKSKEGFKFVYFGLKDPDPSHFNTVQNMKMYIMALEAIVRSSDLVPAYIFILDGKGMSLGHVPISQLRFLKKSIRYLQECSLVNMKKIHFVNASAIVEKTYSLLKPFMNSNVTDSLRFYTNPKLLGTVEDPTTLPPELGGTLPGSIEIYTHNLELNRRKRFFFPKHCLLLLMTEHLKAVVENHAAYFKEDEERRQRKNAERQHK